MRVIVIGAGLGGQLVVKSLRDHQSDASISIFSRHSAGFYSKPSLSNVFTQGKQPKDLIVKDEKEIHLTQDCSVYPHTTVESINREKKTVKTSKGEFSYDKLVLALGAELPQMPWLPESENIFRVNHIDDYQKFFPRVQPESHITIIGGGLIGVEFAHDIAPFCQKVTLIEKSPTLMAAMLPMEVGEALAAALTKRGVTVMTGADVTSVLDNQDKVAITVDGKTLQSDILLAAIGLSPNVALAKEAGLEVNTGISVNQEGQTSDPNIFALGDCAEVCGIVKFYVAPLRICSAIIAQNIMGMKQKIVYEPMPVMLKTPSYPVCFCYLKMPESWDVKIDDDGIEALAYEDGILKGFVLTEKKLVERMRYKKAMPNWLPSE
ncbi:MAG: FAD-dependent oxidoreductase [Pseudomonadota bacterium]|nr:FAD-dependent oxidoreductase [Pseudomonadota bacterium]